MNGIVVDASALMAALSDGGAIGDWMTISLDGKELVAPQQVMFEAANILRRQEGQGLLSPVEALMAHEDLVGMPIELWPYSALAPRVWELRRSVTAYDAAYVALAERLDVPLVTLDVRLTRANGPRCEFLTPPQEVLDAAP